MRRNLRQRDFNRQEIINLIKAGIVDILLSYFFYRNALAVIPMLLVAALYYKTLKNRQVLSKKLQMSSEFRECILCVSGSLDAGYAIENAFVDSRKDMSALFGDNSIICRELDIVRRGLVINIPLEELMRDMAKRNDCVDIDEFVSVFSVAKRNGGDLSEIIESCAKLSMERLDTIKEINTVLSGKLFELGVMRVLPFAMMMYIDFSYRGYFDSLYNNFEGIVLMSICLLIYMIAYWFGERAVISISKGMI